MNVRALRSNEKTVIAPASEREVEPTGSAPSPQVTTTTPAPAARPTAAVRMSALAANRVSEERVREHLLRNTNTRSPDEILAMGPEGAVDYFAANPAAADEFYATATPAQQRELLDGVNDLQSTTGLDAGQLEAADRIWVRGMEQGDPSIQPGLDRYLRSNVGRTDFVERAFLDDLRAGRTDDAFRDRLHRSFQALDMEGSHVVMEAIRADGRLDAFLNATLRDENGDPVDPRVHAGVRRMMETGRLDIYAETLASTSFNVHDPAVSGRPDHPAFFDPSEDAIYFSANTDMIANGDEEAIAKTLAHETFHAFQHDHGGASGALNEGFGVGAINYAFTDDEYSLAESVYGTKNWYRDRSSDPDPDYPLGSYDNADPKLRELLDAIASRDRSELAWYDSAQLEQEYEDFWAPYDRFADDNSTPGADWSEPGGYAEQAEEEMLESREPRESRESREPREP